MTRQYCGRVVGGQAMYARYIPPPQGEKALSRPKSPTAAPTPSQPKAAFATADGFSYARYVPGAKQTKAAAGKSSDGKSSSPISKRKRTSDEAPDSRQRDKKLKTGGDQALTEKSAAVQDFRAHSDAKEVEAKKKKNRRKRKRRTRANSDDSEDSDEPAQSKALRAESPLLSAVSEDTTGSDERAKTQAKRVEERARLERDTSGTPDADATAQASDDVLPSKPKKLNERKKRKERDKKKGPKFETLSDTGQQEEETLRHKTVLERKKKSLKLAGEAVHNASPVVQGEPAELHGLEPLPQPAVVADDESKPTSDSLPLPLWLANPIRASQSDRKSFRELGVLPKAARLLEEKGFLEAFAVQTAALPLLLPSHKHRVGDVLISAATGSGKTLAYALPIVHDVGQSVITRLRALVVLPTRELVKQAQEVFELCARAYDGEERKAFRIGIAIGNQPIQAEKHILVASESRYDPEAYSRLKEHGLRDSWEQQPGSAAAEELHHLVTGRMNARPSRLGPWKGEVVDFASKVDVLICTPGRLVEHVQRTAGFSLDYVRWLVVDEADKLLAQSFQGWLDVVMEHFKLNRFSARDFPDMACSGVRKVILSATLTRDLNLLGQLELRHPLLVVLDSEGSGQVTEHSLPPLLREFAVRVHETGLKPLYLLDLLKGSHMKTEVVGGDEPLSATHRGAVDIKSGSDTDSDTSSESDALASSSDKHSGSGTKENSGTAELAQASLPRCLIFTKSNESALRLARLLLLLDASLSTSISTLTSTTATHIRRKILREFVAASSPVRLIIASDLVARGIDIPRLGHVINYDLPASVAGYVHRVGRTARAGRPGCAWTLLGDEESGWFWGKIAKGQTVRRAQRVERTRIAEMDEARINEYEDALARLGKEALELKRG